MSLTDCYSLREEHRLKVFENRVLRLIFGPKTDEVTGEWRKLHNGKINNLHFSTNIYIYIYIYLAQQSPVGHGLLIREFSRSHTTTHNSR